MRSSHIEVLPYTGMHNGLKKEESERGGFMIQWFKKERFTIQLSRCQANANKIKAEVALERAKHKDTCLIKEIKKLNGLTLKMSLSDVVDGCSREEAIVDKFKEVYMKMYNKNEAEEEISKFIEKN